MALNVEHLLRTAATLEQALLALGKTPSPDDVLFDLAHEGSDPELVLRHPQDLAREAEGWLELKESLQNSMLPMLVEIHLWPRLPAAFHAEIERSYVVLQQAETQGKAWA